jgi:hypothetical protein
MFPNGLNAFPVHKRHIFDTFEIVYHNDFNLHACLKALEKDEEDIE